jgi:hypothetical protein
MLIGLHHAYLLAKRAWPLVISNHFPTAKRPAITTVPAKNAAANADPNTGSEIFSRHQHLSVALAAFSYLS